MWSFVAIFSGGNVPGDFVSLWTVSLGANCVNQCNAARYSFTKPTVSSDPIA